MPSPGRDHVRSKQEPGAERQADAAARAALSAGPVVAGLGTRAAPPAQLRAGPAVAAMLARPGEPLPAPDRSYFEQRFGADLSGARIHRDATAAAAAHSQRARAFAVGRDIGFAAGAYRPDTADGAHLLAHEIAHTLQPGAEHALRRQPDDGPRQSFMEPEEEQVSRPEPFRPAGGVAGDHLLRNYPMLAAKLPPDQWIALANAAERRETAHATNTSQAGEAPKPMTFALTDLLEPGAAFEDVDSADVLFGLFRAGAQGLAAPALIRNEIMRRWFTRNGIRPAGEKVEVTLLDPEGREAGTTTFSFRWRGKEVEDTYGRITVAALDEAIGGIRFEFDHVAGEVRQESEAIGLAAALSVQGDVLKQKLPPFIEKTRARFASTAYEEILLYLKLVQEAAEQAYKLQRWPVAEGFVPGLYAYYDAQSRDLFKLTGQMQDWRLGQEVLGQKQELTKKDVELRLRDTPRDSDDPFEEVSLLYARGRISLDDMKDLHQSMLDRSLIVALVSVAVSLATAGLGGWVAGSVLNLGARPILYGAVAVGTNMAVDTVATMGAEHIVTSFRDFENPYAQAIWRMGAHSPGEYVRNAGIAFGLGALLGGALGFALSRGPKPSTSLVPTETPPAGGGSTVNEPRLTLLSDTTDPATGVRTWQLRTDQGELVTVVGDPATGNGYIWNAATAEARQVVGGRLGGPLRFLGSGDAAGAAAAGATAGESAAPFAVLSDITDAVTSVRTVQLRTAQGELVTVATNTETGSGYIMNYASGEARSIVGGELRGPLTALGPGAEEVAEVATPLMLQAPPAPLALPPGVAGPQLPGVAVTGGAAAGEAAIAIELRQAFADIGVNVSAADRQMLADALRLIPQLPPSAARDNVLALEPVVGAALAGAEGHVDAAMQILREAQREGLTLGQLIQRQRAAWAQLEPQLKSGDWKGFGVGSGDPRAVYSRAMLRLDQQAGRQSTVVPRYANYGDMPFFEGPVARNPTLYDQGIDAVRHGWHLHAVQDMVAGAALQRAGAPLDAFEFRRALGEVQQIGQAMPAGQLAPADAIRMRQLGHLVWQAHYDAYERPEFITETLRRVLGYID